MSDFYDENEAVMFQAAEFGRTDILQHVISTIRSNGGSVLSALDVSKLISVKRMDDDVSALHVAAVFGHSDAVRSLLVNSLCLT